MQNIYTREIFIESGVCIFTAIRQKSSIADRESLSVRLTRISHRCLSLNRLDVTVVDFHVRNHPGGRRKSKRRSSTDASFRSSEIVFLNDYKSSESFRRED